MRQGLANAVDLVIMTRSRKTEQLGLQTRKPGRPAWEKLVGPDGQLAPFESFTLRRPRRD